MNDDQRQVVLGTLLGNGYICKGKKNHYLCMRHSVHHLDWLKSKAMELGDLASANPWYEYETTWTWRSRCDSIFVELRKLYYPKDVKEVSMDWLDSLRDIAIAVWYGDSGCLAGRNSKNACLRTQSFGFKGNKIIETYFNEVGFPCSMNKSRNSFVIVFSVHSTRKFLTMVAPYLTKKKLADLLPPYLAVV